jgi:acyl carrier protein phosphodiesterase
MNWLAHIFLSELNIESQLGNLLNDTCKGRVWLGASSLIEDGMRMHQKVDRFTDNHRAFAMSKSVLGRGLLRGVVVDLVYDLLLTRHWNRYSNIPREVFLIEFYERAEVAIQDYPLGVQKFVKGLIKSDHLRHYQNFNDLEQTFIRVDKRLSKRLLKKESTLSYLPLVIQEFNHIEQHFLEFFPELLKYVAQNSDLPQLSHWNKEAFR